MWTAGVLLVALSLVCVHGGPMRAKREVDEMAVKTLLKDVRHFLKTGSKDQPEAAKNNPEIANLSQDQIQRILDVFAEKQAKAGRSFEDPTGYEAERSLEEQLPAGDVAASLDQEARSAGVPDMARSIEGVPASAQARSFEDTFANEEARSVEEQARDWSYEHPSNEWHESWEKRGELGDVAELPEEAEEGAARSFEDEEARSVEEQARDWSYEHPSNEWHESWEKRGELPDVAELPEEAEDAAARSFEDPQARSTEDFEARSFEEEARSAEQLPLVENLPVENDNPEEREFADEAERSAEVPEEDGVPAGLRETAFKRGLNEEQIERVLDIIHEKQGEEAEKARSLEEPEADPPSTDLFSPDEETPEEARALPEDVTKDQLAKLLDVLKHDKVGDKNARSEEVPVDDAPVEARALPAAVTKEQLKNLLNTLKKMGLKTKNAKKSVEVPVDDGAQADELSKEEIRNIVKHVHNLNKPHRSADDVEGAKFDVSSQKLSDNNETPEASAREQLRRVLDVWREQREINQPVDK